MQKNLRLLCLLLACGMAAHAATILVQDFAASTPAGWTNTPVSGAYSWAFVTSSIYPTATPQSGSHMAKFDSFSISSGNSARLGSPSMDLTSVATASLTFWMYHDPGYSTSNDWIMPQVSTNGGGWTNLLTIAVPRYGTTGWRQEDLDLSAYAGQADVRVGFLATSAYGNAMYLDTVSVTGATPEPMTLWLCAPLLAFGLVRRFRIS